MVIDKIFVDKNLFIAFHNVKKTYSSKRICFLVFRYCLLKIKNILNLILIYIFNLNCSNNIQLLHRFSLVPLLLLLRAFGQVR